MKNFTTTFALSFLTTLALGTSAEASPVDMNQLEAEMSSCGYLGDANAMYTRCLQINHPNHHNGSYERWNARGSLCTELVQNHGAPVWYRQDVANATNNELANSSCVDDYYYVTDDFTQEVAEEMSSCEFLTDPNKVYTNCLQLNHPQLHGGDVTRWNMRGTICTNVANQYDAPIWYRQDVANDANQKLTTSECYDLELMEARAQSGKPFVSGQAVHIESKTFGTHFTNTNGDLRVEHSDDTPTAIQLIKVNGEGNLKFGDLIALRFQDGSFVTAMDSSENFNAVTRAQHLYEWEVFKIVDTSGQTPNQEITPESTFALVSAHGKYFSATTEGKVNAQVPHIYEWEHFQISHLSRKSRGLLSINMDYGSTSGVYNEGDVVGAYASAGASVEFGTELELGEGITLSSTIGAGAEAEANACAGLNPSECAGVYAQAQASAGVYAGNDLDIDSDAGKINVCAQSMAEAGASAEGGAVINGDGATAGGGFEAGATVGSEACAGITGHYGNVGGKAGVTVGPSVSAGMQMSFNFDGCTWSTSVEGDLHLLVGVEFGADGGVNFCHVGEEVAELATDLWYDVMDGEVVEEWTVGAADDVAQWTVGAANDMADWTSGAANDTANWTVGAVNDTADWTSGAAYDVGDWTSGAVYDVGDWTVGAANDIADVAEEAWDWTEGAGNSVAKFFSSWF